MSGPVPQPDDMLVVRIKRDASVTMWSSQAMPKDEFIRLLEYMITSARDGSMTRVEKKDA